MNELDQIAATLAKPDPSPSVVAEGRVRLHRESGRRPMGRFKIAAWTTGAVGVGAAAAAVLVTVTSVGATKAADLSARPVLMAAASTAEAATPATGRYWHTALDYLSTGKVNGKDMKPWKGSTETWVSRDGRAWTGRDGKPVPTTKSWKYGLCDKEVGTGEVEKLPTTPAALRAEMTDAMKHNDDGPVPAEYQDDFVTSCMIDLLTSLPAPARVRAAAFRSLAEMPHSEKLGAKTDHLGRTGEALSITTGGTKTLLIINPGTATVLESYRDFTGGKITTQRITVRAAGWTDTLG